jgi:hypothetical protein
MPAGRPRMNGGRHESTFHSSSGTAGPSPANTAVSSGPPVKPSSRRRPPPAHRGTPSSGSPDEAREAAGGSCTLRRARVVGPRTSVDGRGAAYGHFSRSRPRQTSSVGTLVESPGRPLLLEVRSDKRGVSMVTRMSVGPAVVIRRGFGWGSVSRACRHTRRPALWPSVRGPAACRRSGSSQAFERLRSRPTSCSGNRLRGSGRTVGKPWLWSARSRPRSSSGWRASAPPNIATPEQTPATVAGSRSNWPSAGQVVPRPVR